MRRRLAKTSAAGILLLASTPSVSSRSFLAATASLRAFSIAALSTTTLLFSSLLPPTARVIGTKTTPSTTTTRSVAQKMTASTCDSLPPSLTGKPVKSLVEPGKCQFTEEWTPVPLTERLRVSKTSSVLRFGLPNKDLPLGLSTCACLLAKVSVGGEDVIRPYTPISTNELKGHFDVLIKDYASFGGKLSNHVNNVMKIGDTVDVKHIPFNVKIQAPFAPHKKIVMLVGGTGITPMIQALHAILGDKDSDIKVVMLYGSQSEDDILGRELIDSWAAEYSDRFEVVHVLSGEPASTWTGAKGFIDKDLITKHVIEGSISAGPDAGEDVIFFVCGPPPMYDALCGPRNEKELTGTLLDLGYKKEQVYKF